MKLFENKSRFFKSRGIYILKGYNIHIYIITYMYIHIGDGFHHFALLRVHSETDNQRSHQKDPGFLTVNGGPTRLESQGQ